MKEIVIYDIGRSKIIAVKVIRTYTGLGLADAKKIADSIEAGSWARISCIPEDVVDTIIADFAAFGALASIDDGLSNVASDTPYYVPAENPAPVQPPVANHTAVPKQDYSENDSSFKGRLRRLFGAGK